MPRAFEEMPGAFGEMPRMHETNGLRPGFPETHGNKWFGELKTQKCMETHGLVNGIPDVQGRSQICKDGSGLLRSRAWEVEGWIAGAGSAFPLARLAISFTEPAGIMTFPISLSQKYTGTSTFRISEMKSK